MLLRQKRRFADICAAVLAVLGVIAFTFAAPGAHEPKLHGAAYDVAASAHPHSHGDHTHDDDVEIADNGGAINDHHHADHTHEKAGLVQVAGTKVRAAVSTRFVAFATRLAGNPPDGIDRPPRHRSLT